MNGFECAHCGRWSWADSKSALNRLCEFCEQDAQESDGDFTTGKGMGGANNPACVAA